jgi:hypothetical protein
VQSTKNQANLEVELLVRHNLECTIIKNYKFAFVTALDSGSHIFHKNRDPSCRPALQKFRTLEECAGQVLLAGGERRPAGPS